jgi:hypothetical protein
MISLSEYNSVETNGTSSEALFFRAYETEEIDDEALAELKTHDLTGELRDELSDEFWDIGKIRTLLRALRLTKSHDIVGILRSELHLMMPFMKDVVLLMDDLKKDGESGFENMGDEIVGLITHPAIRHLPYVRAWLMEIFKLEIAIVTPAHLKVLDPLHEVMDMRQILILRGMIPDISYFRLRKTRIDELNPWLQPAFIYGARCLPADEYRVWLGSVRKRLRFPLSDLFCDWALSL